MIAFDAFQGYSPYLPLTGLLVGLLVGLTGVGGGSLMTPLLVLLFGVRPAIAVGTDLLYAALTKGGGAWIHHLHGNVDWQVTRRLALGSVPTAALTLLALARLDAHGSGASRLMTAALGLALLLTAASLLCRQRLLERARRRGASADFWHRHSPTATVVVGAALGALVTVSSVGAGALGVAALTLLHPQLDSRRIVGSDIAHAVPLTLVAGLGHWWLGTVDVLLLAALLIGSLPGIALGAHFAARVPERALRGLLASVLLLIGGKLIFA